MPLPERPSEEDDDTLRRDQRHRDDLTDGDCHPALHFAFLIGLCVLYMDAIIPCYHCRYVCVAAAAAKPSQATATAKPSKATQTTLPPPSSSPPPLALHSPRRDFRASAIHEIGHLLPSTTTRAWTAPSPWRPYARARSPTLPRLRRHHPRHPRYRRPLCCMGPRDAMDARQLDDKARSCLQPWVRVIDPIATLLLSPPPPQPPPTTPPPPLTPNATGRHPPDTHPASRRRCPSLHRHLPHRRHPSTRPANRPTTAPKTAVWAHSQI